MSDSLLDGDITGDFVRHLGVEFGEVTGDRVVATWTAKPDLHQPYGIVHGGVHCSVIETLASVGAAIVDGRAGARSSGSTTTPTSTARSARAR